MYTQPEEARSSIAAVADAVKPAQLLVVMLVVSLIVV